MRDRVANQRGGITPRTMLTVAIVGGAIFSVSDYVSAYWQWYKIRSTTLDMAEFSRNMTVDEMKSDLAKRIKALGITKYSAVTMERDPIDNSKLSIRFDYQRPIYVPPVAADWKLVYPRKFKVSIYQGLPMAKGNL